MLAAQLRRDRERLDGMRLWRFLKRHLMATLLLKQLEQMTDHARHIEEHYNVAEREQKFWMFRFSSMETKVRELEAHGRKT